jgi:hypothetical protein
VETRFSNSYYVYSEPATPPEVPRERVASAKPDELPGKRKNAKAAKPDELPGKRKKITLSGRFPGTSVRQTRLPPSGESRKSQRQQQRKKNRYDLLYERSFEDTLRGRPISSTTPSSVDTERQDDNIRLRSAPREPTTERQDDNIRLRSAPREPTTERQGNKIRLRSAPREPTSVTIPVAVPITQDVDPIVTPISKRRSARIEAQYAAQKTESLTRSESERLWRVFTRGITMSERKRAWREHVLEYYATQPEHIRQRHAEQLAKLGAEEAKSKK